MKKLLLALMLVMALAFSAVAVAQVSDETPPVTTKTYGEPNEAALITVPSCDNDVQVNGHLITTGTTITLNATDDVSAPENISTFFSVLVPASCENGEVEFAGLNDSNIYQDETTCEEAIDDGIGENETQRCVATFWNEKTELLPNETSSYPLEYNGSFVIPQESTHKICFFSVDEEGNEEDVQCQIALVDDGPPEIESVETDHEIIDLEYYSGGNNDNYFDDPKCTFFFINASDTHGIDDVQVNVSSVLKRMFKNLVPDSEEALDGYYADDMHNMPSLENGLVQQDNNLYQYEFCPGEHIYHLYNNFYSVGDGSDNVFDLYNFTKFLEEDLVLGEFEFDVWVNDTTGKEVSTSVNVTIVDLTVPLEVGWNLRSTPLTLEGDEFWPSGSIDAVLGWNSSSQSWRLVTDNSIEPLDALYLHATDRNQIGYIFERDLTSPPLRTLYKGWNLAGVALQLYDTLYNPDYYGYLTYLYDDYGSCVGEDALNPLIFDSNGNRALEVVVSPSQYLNYRNNWGSWYFVQYPWTWIPDIRSGGEVRNDCEQSVSNFEGYWLHMQNEDMMPGFTTTPLPID